MRVALRRASRASVAKNLLVHNPSRSKPACLNSLTLKSLTQSRLGDSPAMACIGRIWHCACFRRHLVPSLVVIDGRKSVLLVAPKSV